MTAPAARIASPPAVALVPPASRVALESACVALVAGGVYSALACTSAVEPWTSASAWLGTDRTVALVPHVAGASAFAVSPVVRTMTGLATIAGLDQARALTVLAAGCGALVVGATYARARSMGIGLLASAAAAAGLAASAPLLLSATNPNSWIVALACWALLLVAWRVGRTANRPHAAVFPSALVASWLLVAGDASWWPWVLVAGAGSSLTAYPWPRLRWRALLGAIAVVTSGAAFCVAAATCLGQISAQERDSAWSVGQSVVAMTGGGLGADLPSRALRALAACATAYGTVGTGLVLCSLAWGNTRQSSRTLAVVTASGLLVTAATWRTLAPEALGTAAAVALAPLVAAGLKSLESLPAPAWWRAALAAWVVGGQVLGASLAGQPSRVLVRDVESLAAAIARADVLASDDWRRASVLINLASRQTGRAPVLAPLAADALRRVPPQQRVLAQAGITRRRGLSMRGLDFSLVPVWGAPLDEALAAFPEDRVVLFGLSRDSGLTEREPAGRPAVFGALGGRLSVPTGSQGMAVIGWTGGGRAAREQRGREEQVLWVDEGQRIGTSLAFPVNAAVRAADEVAIEVNGEVVARSSSLGAALAVLDRMGRIERRDEWAAGDPLRLPASEADIGSLAVVSFRPCATLEGGRVATFPLDRSARSVALTATQPSGATIFVGTTTPDTPIVFAEDAGPDQARADVVDADAGDGRGRVAEWARVHGLSPEALVNGSRFLARMELQVPARDAAEIALALEATHVTVAWADRNAPGRACVVGSDGTRAFEGRSRRFEVRWEDPRAFERGWHPMEREAGRWFRWTASDSARIAVELARVGDVRVRVDASPATGSQEDGAVRLSVNGTPVGPPGGREGPAVRWWLVPASSWRTGGNTITLGTPGLVVPASRDSGHDTRTLGLAVRRVSLELVGHAGAPVAPW